MTMTPMTRKGARETPTMTLMLSVNWRRALRISGEGVAVLGDDQEVGEDGVHMRWKSDFIADSCRSSQRIYSSI
jgi:hypothetical protein